MGAVLDRYYRKRNRLFGFVLGLVVVSYFVAAVLFLMAY